MGKRKCVNTIITHLHHVTNALLMYSSKIIAFNEKFVIKTSQIKSERRPGDNT